MVVSSVFCIFTLHHCLNSRDYVSNFEMCIQNPLENAQGKFLAILGHGLESSRTSMMKLSVVIMAKKLNQDVGLGSECHAALASLVLW